MTGNYKNLLLGCSTALFSVILSTDSVMAAGACLANDCTGYTKTSAQCSGKTAIRCPFDTSKYYCQDDVVNDDTCPDGYQSSPCASYMLQDGQPITVGSLTCRKCSVKTCANYGYLTSMPLSDEFVSTAYPTRKYLSCEWVKIADRTGALTEDCVSCVNNNCYQRPTFVTCSGAKYCCPETTSYNDPSKCSYIESLVGGCQKANYTNF